MSFLMNEFSLHGQYQDPHSFESALATVMSIRTMVKREGSYFACSRRLLESRITTHPEHSLQQLVGSMDLNRRRALLSWITREGPFWEEERKHCGDDWFECNGEIVTDSAIGEASWLCANGDESRLISFAPSDWERSPLSVAWCFEDRADRSISVENYWKIGQVRDALEEMERPLSSWKELEQRTRARCERLTIANDAFRLLHAQPFVLAAANRALFLMEKLNRTCRLLR